MAAVYLEAQESIGGARPNITSVAQECRVSRHYVQCIEKQLQNHGIILRANNTAQGSGTGSFGS